MVVYAQSSQRATWPPRAAVRQLSIADITFNWPRLTWPALAVRQAAPWSRKMSATSRTGRATSACALLGRLVSPDPQWRQPIQWADDRADGVGGDARIEHGGLELGMTEQHLDHADVGVLLQEVGREAVAQCVRRHPFGDLGHVGGGMDRPIELAHRDVVDRVLSGKQPGFRPRDPPPVTQQPKQLRREHRQAILAPLALLD